MYPTVLLPIAKTLKQEKCPTDEYIKKEWYMSTMAYYSVIKKKEWANSYQSNIHESSCHHNEWCKSEKKRQISHIGGIWTLTPMNQLTKEKQSLQIRIQNYGHQKGKVRESINWEVGINKSTIIHIKQVINKDPLYSKGVLLNTLLQPIWVKNLYVELKKILYTYNKHNILNQLHCNKT